MTSLAGLAQAERWGATPPPPPAPGRVLTAVLSPQLHFSPEDCAFEEEIRPDGYNVYRSQKHGLPVSLSSARQRQLYKDRGFLPLSHFLPMLPKSPPQPQPEPAEEQPEADAQSAPLETDSMDPFGIASKLQLVESPSFQK